jgi:hypothetical protein
MARHEFMNEFTEGCDTLVPGPSPTCGCQRCAAQTGPMPAPCTLRRTLERPVCSLVGHRGVEQAHTAAGRRVLQVDHHTVRPTMGATRTQDAGHIGWRGPWHVPLSTGPVTIAPESCCLERNFTTRTIQLHLIVFKLTIELQVSRPAAAGPTQRSPIASLPCST